MTDTKPTPTLGLILLGGPLSGAMIRDVRLANALAERGYRVHVWWAMDRSKAVKLDPRITQHWLFHSLRYSGRFPSLREQIGRWSFALFSDRQRCDFIQTRQQTYQRLMQATIRAVCDKLSDDPAIIQRIAEQFKQTGVTHVLSSLGMFGMWAHQAIKHLNEPIEHLISFQGHEMYLPYAQNIGREQDLLDRLREMVQATNIPAVAVSEPYRQLLIEHLQIDPSLLTTIPPGIPAAEPMSHDEAMAELKKVLPRLDPNLPIIGYLGRQDSEKGLDLLLYAAKILTERGLKFQIAIAGSSLFSKSYRHACRQIIIHLQMPLIWTKQITGKPWTAFLTASHCVVYPSIVRETFGMVPVEAIAHGTPAIVPNLGGATTTIEADGQQSGLRFKPWDSGYLATQIQTMLTDTTQYQQFVDNCPAVADHYSVDRMTDRFLAHLNIS